ncbi:GNAT family N-acetyltransferase [Zooshikella sp. RANM57]|uniref:GNAT family N-acetyltransferase n=1 Tax=Zooshikella sp. RANM57 TaxID=3425863 RepID=UPI003D6F4E3E
MTLKIVKVHPDSDQAILLQNELSAKLLEITGDTGESSFNTQDFNESTQSIFIILLKDSAPVACGSIRPISSRICEIKRMYSKLPKNGFGNLILAELETFAKESGYKEIWLSTRKINSKAIQFYLKNNYRIQPNYGRYQFTTTSICFSKQLAI